jgi:hypothetical protein
MLITTSLSNQNVMTLHKKIMESVLQLIFELINFNLIIIPGTKNTMNLNQNKGMHP